MKTSNCINISFCVNKHYLIIYTDLTFFGTTLDKIPLFACLLYTISVYIQEQLWRDEQPVIYVLLWVTFYSHPHHSQNTFAKFRIEGPLIILTLNEFISKSLWLLLVHWVLLSSKTSYTLYKFCTFISLATWEALLIHHNRKS